MVKIFHDVLIPICLIIGPIIGYIPQYREIHRSGNPKAFSSSVILILLVANILRIFFWVEKRFELALLIQSIVMILAQLLLLELMVRLRSRTLEYSPENYRILGRDVGQFWNWTDIGKYVQFLTGFSIFVGLFTLLNILVFNSTIYTEMIGTFALLIESTLAMPQLLLNHQFKTTRGLRGELVFAWALGDAAKTILFLARGAPIQFLICGVVQLVVDFGIFYQMRIYGENAGVGVENSVLASSVIIRDDLEMPKIPAKSLSKSFDEFEVAQGDTPKRSTSLRSRSPNPFTRTM